MRTSRDEIKKSQETPETVTQTTSQTSENLSATHTPTPAEENLEKSKEKLNPSSEAQKTTQAEDPIVVERKRTKADKKDKKQKKEKKVHRHKSRKEKTETVAVGGQSTGEVIEKPKAEATPTEKPTENVAEKVETIPTNPEPSDTASNEAKENEQTVEIENKKTEASNEKITEKLEQTSKDDVTNTQSEQEDEEEHKSTSKIGELTTLDVNKKPVFDESSALLGGGNDDINPDDEPPVPDGVDQNFDEKDRIKPSRLQRAGQKALNFGIDVMAGYTFAVVFGRDVFHNMNADEDALVARDPGLNWALNDSTVFIVNSRIGRLFGTFAFNEPSAIPNELRRVGRGNLPLGAVIATAQFVGPFVAVAACDYGLKTLNGFMINGNVIDPNGSAMNVLDFAIENPMARVAVLGTAGLGLFQGMQDIIEACRKLEPQVAKLAPDHPIRFLFQQTLRLGAAFVAVLATRDTFEFYNQHWQHLLLPLVGFAADRLMQVMQYFAHNPAPLANMVKADLPVAEHDSKLINSEENAQVKIISPAETSGEKVKSVARHTLSTAIGVGAAALTLYGIDKLRQHFDPNYGQEMDEARLVGATVVTYAVGNFTKYTVDNFGTVVNLASEGVKNIGGKVKSLYANCSFPTLFGSSGERKPLLSADPVVERRLSK